MAKNIPQVRRGQLIETPHGPGFVSMFWGMQLGTTVDQVAYFVYLVTPRPAKFGYPFYCAAELRQLNPTIYFPAHRGEILRPNRRQP